MTHPSPDPHGIESLFATIATDLQQVPASAPRTERVAASVVANNARVLQASGMLLRMEDHPDTFDAWCRAFVPKRSDA